MAKYTASAWGSIRGKLGDGVGSVWKGIPIVKVRVIPSNPNTPDQQRIRGIYGELLGYAVILPEVIYRKYADIRRMTQSNFFLKYNIPMAYDSDSFPNIFYSPWVLRVLPAGDLDPAGIIITTYDPDTGDTYIKWDSAILGKGAPDDKIWLAVHDAVNKVFHLRIPAKIRSDGEGTVNIPVNLVQPIVAHIYAVNKVLPDSCWQLKPANCPPPERPLPLLSVGDTKLPAFTKIIWQYGETGVAGNGFNQVSYPQSAYRLDNGNILISDTGNNRVIEVDTAKNIIHQWNYNKARTSVKLPANHILTTDYLDATGRIVELDSAGNEVWFYVAGFHVMKIKVLDNGNILFSVQVQYTPPTGNIVREIDKLKNTIWQYGQWGVIGDGFNELAGPYGIARNEKTGNTYIGEVYNKRVIEVDNAKNILWQYGHNGTIPEVDCKISDPSGIDFSRGKTILVSDRYRRWVIRLSRGKKIVWQYGKELVMGSGVNELNAPFDIDRLPHHHVLITDGGNHRVIEVC